MEFFLSQFVALSVSVDQWVTLHRESRDQDYIQSTGNRRNANMAQYII
jgi:hypothetical protein